MMPTEHDLKNLNKSQKRALLQKLLQEKEKREAPKQAALSFAQQRLWFLTQLDTNNPSYNLLNAYRIEGSLQIEALQQSLNEIVKRHEALRTLYPLGEDLPTQKVLPHEPFELPIINLCHLPQDQWETEAHRVAITETRQSFDLTQDRPFRFRLIKLSDQVFILLVITHHISSDNWSLKLINRELEILYQAFCNNKPSPLKPLSLQYREYAAWERETLTGKALQEQIDYWKERLADMSVTELATDKTRPSVQSSDGDTYVHDLPPALGETVKEFARERSASPYIIYLAAFQVLLYRYTGDSDVNCGTVIANRDRSDIEDLVGFFVNTMVMRTDMSDVPDFNSVVERVKQAALGAHEYARVPFDRLVDELHPKRDLSRNPLCQLTFQYGTLPELNLAGLKTENRFDADYGIARFDLETHFMEYPSGPKGIFVYNVDLFERPTVQSFAVALQTLLESACAEPDQPVSSLSIVSPAEKKRILGWGDLITPFPDQTTIHRLFEQQASQAPQSIALVDGDEERTYGQLNESANRLAHFLIERGVKPEDPVGVCLERTLDFPAVFLGILKAGGAYLPLDPKYPEDRLNYTLENSRASCILTHSEIESCLAKNAGNVPYWYVDQLNLTSYSPDNPQSHVLPTQLAYLIYTSGSTGRPKGVAINHRNVIRLVKNTNYVDVKPDDALLQVHSISFDASTFEVWGSLLNGARLVLMPTNAIDLIPKLVERHGVTILSVTSPVFNLLVDEHQQALKNLRQVMTGGDKTSVAHVARYLNIFSDEKLVHCYGPTEATTFASTCELRRFEGKSAPIGYPIANTALRVLDNQKVMVPAGFMGELCIGGPGVARGYLNRPALTAQKFIPDPYSDEPGARLYCSGDRAVYRQDGALDFRGRADRQVKIRGYRIELGEIENILNNHPKIQKATVIAREDRPGSKRLVAYLVAAQNPDQPQAPEFPTQLARFLSEMLPEFMVPSDYLFLPFIPLTRNGKVDIAALPVPTVVKREEKLVAPRNADEALLRDIWSQLLGVFEIGIHDNFFELGGDSILSIQVIARANRQGMNLTPKQLFFHQTIAGLSAQARLKAPEAEQEEELLTGAVPMTPIQRRFFEHSPESPSDFVQSLKIKLKQPVDIVLLEPALHHLCRHHDSLRLRFKPTSEGWIQEYAAPEATRLFHLIVVSEKEATANVRKTLRTEQERASLQALDLTKGPMMAATYFDWGQTQELLLTINHLVIDTVSMRVLLEDLETLLTQLETDQEPSLPPKTTSFGKWTSLLEKYTTSTLLEAERSFWLGSAGEACPQLLKQENPGPNTHSGLTSFSTELSPEETQALIKQAPAAYRTRIHEILAAALLSSSGREAVRIHLEGHGRQEIDPTVDLTRTTGWFTTLYPLTLATGGQRTPDHLLKTVKEQLRKVPHGGLGYGLLRYGTGETANILKEISEPEISFNYLGRLEESGDRFHLESDAVGGGQSPESRRDHLLDIVSLVTNGTLTFHWFYNQELNHRQTIDAFAATYMAHLRELIAHCLSPEAGGFTPSDFPHARLNQPKLDRVCEAFPGMEEIYTTSPMQQGMLFHDALKQKTNLYTQQLCCTLRGTLNADHFRRAWQEVSNRHTVLRTVFFLDEGEPQQIVLDQAELDWREHDWRGAEQAGNLEAFLETDLNETWNLTQKPPHRMTLIHCQNHTYYLVWTMHHVLLDGWSLPILLKEAAAIYMSYQGAPPALEAPLPYREYITWLMAQDKEKANAYWRRYLADFSEPNQLPKTASRSATHAAHGTLEQKVAPELARSLETFARTHRLTLSTLIQGVWSILLGRYTARNEAVFGVTMAGRPASLNGVERGVGLFINTLPLRVSLTEKLPISTWLENLQARFAESREFEFSSLAEIQAASQVPPGTALFESIVVFENYPMDGSLFSDWKQVELEAVRMFEKVEYPLVLQAMPGKGLHLKSIYDPSRFSRSFIQSLFTHMIEILSSIQASPHLEPAQIEVLSPDQRHDALVTWNDTTTAYSRETLMHQLFEAQVVRNGQAVALEFEDQSMSYEQLNTKANQLAHYLMEQGIGPHMFVGVCFFRSMDMAVALMAILKSNAAYVPLDPVFPNDRIAYILEDTEARILLTHKELKERLDLSSLPVTCLDEQSFDAYPQHNPEPRINAEHFAYTIFTSGSSGRPKGVLVQHRPVINLIEWVNQTYQVGPGDRLLFTTSLCFDLSVYDVFGILGAGATVYITSDEALRDPECLAELLNTKEITFWDSAPAALQQLTAFFPAKGTGSPDLRLVFMSGDWIPLTLPTLLKETFPNVDVIGLGGATEATIWSNFFRVETVLPEWKSIPYGLPIQNAHYHILDAQLRLTPVGVPGPLYIGHECVSWGYFNQPGLTAERYIPDPFSEVPGRVLYTTGDRACRMPDGNIEFLGRLDQQVKIRGYRIEPGEIESLLLDHPQVREAVVLVREDTPGNKYLTAYVTDFEQDAPEQPDSHPLLEVLRTYLRDLLPEYMMPSAFVFLQSLPVTDNGKLDRKSLPSPYEARTQHAEKDAVPSDSVEQALSEIWQQILGVEHISRSDNFFELGGHSLLATQVISMLRSQFPTDISLGDLFQRPTLSALAELLRQGESASEDETTWEQGSRPDRVPLSFAQERLWFLYRLEPDSPFYNTLLALRFTGNLQVTHLERALDAIVERHEILRTHFEMVDNKAFQVVSPSASLNLTVEEKFEFAGNEPLLVEEINREGALPFNLSEGPVMKVRLLKVQDDEFILLLAFHHIVIDGWSLGILLSELAALYRAFSLDEPYPLPELKFQYADFSLWQRRWLEGERLRRQQEYWVKRLEGAPDLLKLPYDFPRGDKQTYNGKTTFFSLPKEIQDGAVALCRERDLTIFMVLIAAFNVLMNWFSKEEDILIGTDIANRNRVELEPLIGFFVNQLVLRGDLSGEPGFSDLLDQVRQTTLEAYENQDIPFNKLVEALNPKRGNHPPVFQVKLVLQNAPVGSHELPGLNMSPVDWERGTAQLDLLLVAHETDEGLKCAFEFNTDLFLEETIKRLQSHFQTIMTEICREPDQSVEALRQKLTQSDKELQKQARNKFKSFSKKSFKGFRKQR